MRTIVIKIIAAVVAINRKWIINHGKGVKIMKNTVRKKKEK